MIPFPPSAYKRFEALFADLSRTQHHICKIDDILIQSDTDPFVEKEAQDDAEILFSSPKAKAP